MSFLETGLDEALCKRLEGLGYHKPTDIQKLVIPSALRGSDILATAQTGTGKTAAFLLPLVSILLSAPARHRLPRLLIIEPTRELAYQVFEEACRLFPEIKERIGVFVGGESPVKQERVLHKGVDIVVATPGRLLDLIDKQKILFHHTHYAVVDEADRMLDMGFLDDVDRILGAMSQRHQILMLSATMDAPIEKLAARYMLSPKRFEAHQSNSTASTITQYSITTTNAHKMATLLGLLKQEGKGEPTILFCNRKRDIPTIVSRLKKEKWPCEALHGDMHQNDRTATLGRLKAGEINLLVATDVAARGLDVDRLGVVINWDVPVSADDYVHRIGRSGRAGQQGRAFTFVSPAEAERWATINTEGRVETLHVTTKEETSTREARKPEEKKQSSEKTEPQQEKPLLKANAHGHQKPTGPCGFGDRTPAFFNIVINNRTKKADE